MGWGHLVWVLVRLHPLCVPPPRQLPRGWGELGGERDIPYRWDLGFPCSSATIGAHPAPLHPPRVWGLLSPPQTWGDLGEDKWL